MNSLLFFFWMSWDTTEKLLALKYFIINISYPRKVIVFQKNIPSLTFNFFLHKFIKIKEKFHLISHRHEWKARTIDIFIVIGSFWLILCLCDNEKRYIIIIISLSLSSSQSTCFLIKKKVFHMRQIRSHFFPPIMLFCAF